MFVLFVNQFRFICDSDSCSTSSLKWDDLISINRLERLQDRFKLRNTRLEKDTKPMFHSFFLNDRNKKMFYYLVHPLHCLWTKTTMMPFTAGLQHRSICGIWGLFFQQTVSIPMNSLCRIELRTEEGVCVKGTITRLKSSKQPKAIKVSLT